MAIGFLLNPTTNNSTPKMSIAHLLKPDTSSATSSDIHTRSEPSSEPASSHENHQHQHQLQEVELKLEVAATTREQQQQQHHHDDDDEHFFTRVVERLCSWSVALELDAASGS